MSSNLRRTSHLSRHLTALRLQNSLRPAQLAAHLGASNVSKVGGLIRSFELGQPICEYWLDKLIEGPRSFCTPRATAEDNAWARARAEDWAAEELKRFGAKGHLHWSRRERTWYDQRGLNPRRVQVTFEERGGGGWMQVQGSAQKFLLCSNGQFTTKGPGLDQPC